MMILALSPLVFNFQKSPKARQKSVPKITQTNFAKKITKNSPEKYLHPLHPPCLHQSIPPFGRTILCFGTD